ncbi:MAG: translocation/assembly module TamB domain-containing protein [bacterium]|nr:translocation/assembly module TamB domain-containing protein [bacterium]
MRLWLKILLLSIAGILLLGAGVAYYLFEMHGLERIVTARLNKLMPSSLPFQVSIGDIDGSLLDDLTIRELRVRFDDSLGGQEIFYTENLSASYSWRNLIDNRINFSSVRLDSTRITLVQDSVGRFGLPTRPGPKATDSAGAIPEFVIDKLSIENLAVTVFKPNDTLQFFDINLHASIASADQTVALEITQANINSNQSRYLLSSLTGQITYSHQLVAFRDLTISRDSTHIKLNGAGGIRQKAGHITFNADNLDLRDIGPWTGAKLNGMLDLYGSITFSDSMLNGTLGMGGRFMIADINNLFMNFHFHLPQKHLVFDTVYGLILDRCAVDGSGEIIFSPKPETYRLDLAIEHFNLESLIKGTLPSDLNADIHMEGSSFKSETMLLSVTGDFYDSYFADYPIQVASGKVDITTKKVTFPEPFAIEYYGNRFEVTGDVEYSKDLSLLVNADLPNLEAYQGKLFIKELAGRAHGEASLSGSTKDPDLQAFITSDSAWIYDIFTDSLELGVNVSKIFSEQSGQVIATALNGALYDIPFDTLFTYLQLHQQVVDVDTVFFYSPDFRAMAHGYLHHRETPQKVYVDSVTLLFRDQRLYNRGQIELAVDDRGLNIERGAIASGGSMAMALGRYDYDGDLNLALSVNDIPLRAWASLFRPDFPLDGRASLQGKLGGSLRAPLFELTGEVDSVAWKDLHLGDLRMTASYRERTLTIDSSLLTSDTGIYRAHGNFNVDLDLTADSIQILDRPFDLTINATDHRFDLVEAFLPSVEYLGGDMRADVRLYGTPNAPHLEGAVTLANARLKYYDLVDTVFADSAEFRMRDNQIMVDQIEAYVKDKRAPSGKSIATIEGDLTFKQLNNIIWNIDVSLPRAFPVYYELDDIHAVVEGDLSVQGESPPEVTGDLTILSARYRANFAEAEEGSPIMAVLAGDQAWNLNINVEVPSNFWIENDDIDAEFAGFLNIIRERGEYRFIGEMEILRGQAPLFDRSWTIQSGSRAIYDNVAEPNPTLDVTACTIIRGIATDDEPRKDEELCVVVTGTLEEPQLAVSGDAGFSREDLLPLLVTNSATSDANGSSFTGLEQRLTGLLGTQVSQIGSRQLSRLGVETFEIDPLYSGKFDPLKSRVTLGFYTTPSLYVYGRSSLSGATGRELGFEYRLNKSFLVEGRRDEEDLYHLNLKLHWEFK